jgi:hypothetical protein
MVKIRKKNQLELDVAINHAIIDMRGHSVTSDEYAEILTRVERLTKMRDKPQQVSPDALVAVAANLTGIFMIIKHENVNVITSKALGFITRTKTP